MPTLREQNTSPIKNIIFDLGGVLLNIDYHLTFQAFAQLGVENFAKQYAQSHQSPLFDLLETGKIEPNEFRQQLCKQFKISPLSDDFDRAWSAMIVHYKPSIFKLLDELRAKYRLFLFSNTNAIHYQRFQAVLQRDIGADDLAIFFEEAYYSHTLGLRKPDPESYKKILSIHALQAAETLFIDDTFANVAGAKKAGLKTLFLPPEKSIYLLEHYIDKQLLE